MDNVEAERGGAREEDPRIPDTPANATVADPVLNPHADIVGYLLKLAIAALADPMLDGSSIQSASTIRPRRARVFERVYAPEGQWAGDQPSPPLHRADGRRGRVHHRDR